jgi:aminopeptidase YwaD
VLAGLPLVFNGIGNKSPGANDNASGTGVVLQLADVLRSRPKLLAKFNLTILITSAEEMGTMGSLYHVQKHLAALRQSSVKVLNFDSIGIEGRLALAGAKDEQALVELAEQAAEQEEIPISKFNLIGALYDHIPFVEQGLEAITFVTVGGAAWSIHTAADTPDKLYWRGFERAGKVALRMIEMMGDGS